MESQLFDSALPLLDLRASAKTLSLQLHSLPSLSAGARNVAIAYWRARMVEEYTSACRLALLLPQLCSAGLPGDHAEVVAAMISCELGHAGWFAAVVSALGGDPVARTPAPETALPSGEGGGLGISGLLLGGCTHKTLGVALIEAECRSAHPGELSVVLEDLKHDEVRIAGFLWKLVGELLGDAAQRKALCPEEALVPVLSSLVDAAQRLARASGSEGTLDLGAVGVLDERSIGAVLRASTEQMIPWLTQSGLDAESVWSRLSTP